MEKILAEYAEASKQQYQFNSELSQIRISAPSMSDLYISCTIFWFSSLEVDSRQGVLKSIVGR